MSTSTILSNMSNSLDSLHEIIKNLRDLFETDKKVSDTRLQKIPIELEKLNQQQTENKSIYIPTKSKDLDTSHEIAKDSQHQLKYATISFLPKNETTQELKSRCSHHEGIVSRNVKIFQKYINQSLKQQNPFSERKTTRNSI